MIFLPNSIIGTYSNENNQIEQFSLNKLYETLLTNDKINLKEILSLGYSIKQILKTVKIIGQNNVLNKELITALIKEVQINHPHINLKYYITLQNNYSAQNYKIKVPNYSIEAPLPLENESIDQIGGINNQNNTKLKVNHKSTPRGGGFN